MATIMIVEDDRQTNDAVSEYLKSFGHRMLSAYDGDEALQLFECSSIDLIILDIMIPQKTGLAVLHTIRQKALCQSSCSPQSVMNILKLQVSMNRLMTTLQNLFQWFFLGGELLPSYGEAGKQFHLIL